MRIAIMSDIHGFDLALRNVLDDIEANGPFDAIVAAGDLCETGPRPDEVVRICRSAGSRRSKQYGRWRHQGRAGTGDDAPNLRYAAERLGTEGVAGSPRSLRDPFQTPPGSTGHGDDLLIVLANPHNLEDSLDPDCSPTSSF